MKVHIDGGDKNESAMKHLVFEDRLSKSTLFDQPGSKYHGNECLQITEKLCNSPGLESQSGISHCDLDMLDISEESCSIPENGDDAHKASFTPEIQQASRIFQSLLLDKHKAVTAPFWFPVGDQAGNEMCLKKIDDKFVKRDYESITEFVADFRQMLENCYRYHGFDHWLSKQAQKLELILEQKLTLLSRTLREKTSLAVTSRGRFGTEDEKAPVGISTRRRSAPRNLAAISVCGSESIMVQALRLEEQQRAKEEKRQRDLEKKEAGEASAKEVEEWERSLLSLAEPWPIGSMWELPAIGHFLCLAQTALNLPEIVFYELERCLLMPRCSSFLAKVMTSLLCSPHRRMTLHRRPALPYRRWEAELRQKVLGWYQAIGRAKDQEACAEHLGLCHRFFWTLGETSPLEEKPFHLLPFNQRVWLLKGLCDNIYETQKDVQDAVLGQPIHECRESILGYDSQENTYIHFPHFCGADLRIYRQSPCLPLEFPLAAFSVKKLEPEGVDRTGENLSTCSEVKEGNWEFCLRVQDDGSDESEVDWKDPDTFPFPCKEELSSPESIKDKHTEVKQSREWKKKTRKTDCEPCLRVGKNCYTGKFPAHFQSANASEDLLPSDVGAAINNGSSCQIGHLYSKCSMDSLTIPEPLSCFCSTAEADKIVGFGQSGSSSAEKGKIPSKKKRRKKMNEKSHRVKAGKSKLGLKRLRQTRVAKSTTCKVAADLKRKDKRKKHKLGRKLVLKKTQDTNQDHPSQLPVEPTFKLVCTSLDELRDLISKTEDELDELESTKKRCERWYIKREAVKELHITLIRLLNELLPWEPKLLKAFHRNRARLRKENDDFTKHPEYEKFVREDWVAFESEGDASKESCLSTEISRELKDEDKTERIFKGTADCEHYIGNDSLGHLISRPEDSALSESGPFTRSAKRRQSGGPDEDFSLGKKGKMFDDNSVTPEQQLQVTSRDQITAGANALSTKTTSAVTPPPGGLRRCNPIQALFAKSVGNKVTLISHPQVAVADQCRVVSTALTTPQPQPRPVSIQTHASMPSSVQRPMQVVYKAPEGLSVVRNNGTPVKFSVQPANPQKTVEKAMQQVIILPTNLLLQNTEEKQVQQPPSITAAPPNKPATLLSNTSGFPAGENKIPVQQVSPLKNIRTVMTSSAASPGLQKSVSCGVSPAHKKIAQPTLKGSTTSTSATTVLNKCDLNQELKTVCIRDSQSIHVTTRGGNTGVVKVQNSDSSGTCVLPSSPVFTLAPKFQAFLVSKASTLAPSTGQITTTKLLPFDSSLKDKGASINSVLKSANPVKPSPLIETLNNTVPFNKDLLFSTGSVSDNTTKNAQILIGINSLISSNAKTNANFPSSGMPVQTAASENIIRLAQKRPQDTSTDLSSFKKVLLVASTATVPAAVSSIVTTSASAFQGSKVKFLTQAGSACSTITVSEGLVSSESSVTPTTTSSVMKVRPNLGQAIGYTTGIPTELQANNLSGLTARILHRPTITSKTTAETATRVAPLVVSNVLATSNGHYFVQNSNSAANIGSPVNVNGPLKATASNDGKSVTFSTGHMASTAVQQKSTSYSLPTSMSISDILNNRSKLVSGSAPNIGCSVLGSPINKGILARGGMQDKPLDGTSPILPSTSIKPPITSSITRVAQPLALSTTPLKPVLDNPSTGTPLIASTLRSPINTISGATTVQDKVLINTTAPLAPGTQLLINNTRFVVPPQGLAPGGHILLISSPTVQPTGQVGPNHVYPAPKVAGTLIPPASSVVQGLRMVAPFIRAQETSIRQPAAISAKSEQSVNLLTAIRSPSVSMNSSPLTSQLGTSHSSVQQSLGHILRLPSFLLPEVKEHSAASSCSVTTCPKENATASAQSQSCLPSMTTPDLLQKEKPSVAAAKTVISWPSPVVTVSPMCSTVSRMQTLPVATVPPISSSVNSSQTTCVATISPSINTLLMSTCQPVRPVQPGHIRMTVPEHPVQVKSKASTQVSDEQNISELLLSPDGAILNALRCSSPQNLSETTDKTTVAVTTTNTLALHTLDSHRMVTSDNPE
ncbi:LOW QUALITY PROTEIN: uncharacterized protein KIAA2026-like [Silurus meridionalis]|uniref:LOW QUALITY PROTEIN: uncharacterized protein KIAA2026-like n=1 Tax=Silurus meridionalis TaxID=175797 RepID=UPI001EEB6F4D|nr:LOW QUALITY PROTEIN: uncharacterized protein KIAA2026-like [Silurus meridionalis]